MSSKDPVLPKRNSGVIDILTYCLRKELTRMSTRHNFTNSFRLIYDLRQYCNSDSIGRDELLRKLELLQASFETIPEIADKRINPLLNEGIKELKNSGSGWDWINEFKSYYLRLCNSLVEILDIEVRNEQESKSNPSPITPEPSHENRNLGKCPVCKNLINSSNKSLLCGKCGAQFCQTCEGWFRKEERKRGDKPLCENCFIAEQERLKKDVEEWNNKGIALKNLSRYDEAIKAYDKALDLDPKFVYAWYNKGSALDDLGRYDEAIKAYDKALDLYPKFVYAWNGKGIALKNLSRYDEAIKAYDKALDLDPKYVLAWHNKGSALDDLGR